MAAMSTKKHLSERTFEQLWEIRNWTNVLKSEELIRKQTIEIQCKAEKVVYAIILVGLEVFHSGSCRSVRYYWKFLHKHYCLGSVQAELVIEPRRRDGTTWRPFQSTASGVIGKIINIEHNLWTVEPVSDNYSLFTSLEGSWINEIMLTLKNLPYVAKEMEFMQAHKNKYTRNMAALLKNKLNSDVKIHTKDNFELYAHRAILWAQCPAFFTIFETDFMLRNNGVVIVDISAKTMKILLSYWYTGELSPSWKDDDTVFEFTYAAGKYQMTPILKMLDDLLKLDERYTDKDVELLRLVEQLSLKNAEAKILKLVIQKINQAENGAHLLDLFSLTTDNFDEGTFTFSQVLKAFDDVLAANNFDEASFRDVQLMALASKNGHKNVEFKLLDRIIDTVNKASSAKILFALFDKPKEKHDDVFEARDLLVRANPT